MKALKLRTSFVIWQLAFVILSSLLAFALPHRVLAGSRTIPKPLPNHPGNIFLAGEEIVLTVPSDAAWEVLDYEGKFAQEIQASNGGVRLGKLPSGYYELRQISRASTNRIAFGVLEPLRAPTPL